jgi:hypothetical protein
MKQIKTTGLTKEKNKEQLDAMQAENLNNIYEAMKEENPELAEKVKQMLKILHELPFPVILYGDLFEDERAWYFSNLMNLKIAENDRGHLPDRNKWPFEIGVLYTHVGRIATMADKWSEDDMANDLRDVIRKAKENETN